MPFTFGIPFTKVSKDDAGKMMFEGVASSTSLDTHNCRMAKSALESMEAFRGIALLPSHTADPLTELGTVDEIHMVDNQVFVKGSLDETNPDAIRLYERLLAGHDYGLSVGGRVTQAHFELEKGRRVRVLDTVVLDHVALTRPGYAANPDAYIAIAKSVEKEYPLPENRDDQFAEQAEIARLAPGTKEAMDANRKAQGMTATVLSGIMTSPRKKIE